MRPLLLTFLLACATSCSCGDDSPPGGEGDPPGQDGDDTDDGPGTGASICLSDTESLEVTPGNQTATVNAQTPPAFTFVAKAKLAQGGTRTVTRSVGWSLHREDDTPPGTITQEGVYQPSAGAGGKVTITATDTCGHSASATLELKLEATFQEPAPEVTARFLPPAGTPVVRDVASGKLPAVVYPSSRTRFPRNIYKVLFQWKRAGHDHFRLTFQGPYSKTVIYSDGSHPSCAAAPTAACFEADTQVWLAIAGSNAGAVSTLTIEGVTAGDSNVYQAPAIELGFSKRDVKGAIFYWSTTAAGIRRASISDAEPEAYVVGKPVATVLPNGAGTVKCVACHTVSRSGKKLFAFTQAGKTGGYVYNVTLQPPPEPILTTEITTQKGFGTFRPDDARVVATVGNLLKEFDADTGAKLADLPVPEGTNPDWSPLGAELAYSDQGGDSPGGANLSVLSYDGGVWSNPRTLVPAGGLTNLFPSYSPDGAFIAYARGKGGHGDKTLQLWLAQADGSAQPVELVNANRVVNGELTAGQHENNMPTWAPSGDYEWIAFNSIRPYGVVYPNGGTQQIWVAAIDKSKLGTGVDPSFPAFRFAFQGLAENNHRAFWTLDVRDPPDAGTPACVGLGSICGAGSACCAGLTCAPHELGSSCQPESSGGACLTAAAACSQTSGPDCCSGLVCDVGAGGGGTVCQTVGIQ